MGLFYQVDSISVTFKRIFTSLSSFFSFTGSYQITDDHDIVILRVLRVLRVLKLARFNPQSILFARTIQASFPALKFFFFMTSMLLVIFGTIVYCVERGEFKVTPEHPEGAFYRPKMGGGEEVSPFRTVLFGIYWVNILLIAVVE